MLQHLLDLYKSVRFFQAPKQFFSGHRFVNGYVEKATIADSV